MADRTRANACIERLEMARRYAGQFYDDLTDDEWFWSPQAYTTHVAWQVAHIAVSEYNLCIRRVRGRLPEDETLVSDHNLALFGLGSTPVADREKYPAREEILRMLDAVRGETLKVLRARTDADLDVPVEQPHPVFKTKLGAVEYCAPHEFLHVGQIGMLRRLMRKAPIR